MRFSIIIPNYNKAEYLRECLDSVFHQTFDSNKYEVLLIDDGSTDNSLEIIKEYPVKLFQTNRKMPGGARNKGLDNAIGEYIIFLDSDDYFYQKDVLEKLDQHITGEDIVNLSLIKECKKGYKDINDFGLSLVEKIEKSPLLGCPTKCFKRKILEHVRFQEGCYYEDMSFTLEALCQVEKESDFHEPFIFYRFVPGSITKAKEISAKKMTDMLIQISRFYYFCDQYPEYRKYILKRIRNTKLKERIDILNQYFETGYNAFFDFFK